MNTKELAAKQKALRESYEYDLRTICRLVNPHSILEWGPGASTKMMLEEVPHVEILTIEHNGKWYNYYKEVFKSNPNVDLQLKVISMKGGVSEGYVGYPALTKKQFHVVFIDGRHRADCLAIASLLPGSPYVVIHDTKRINYQKYFKLFKNVVHNTERNTTILSNRCLKILDTPANIPWINKFTVGQTIGYLTDLLILDTSFYYTRFGDAEIINMNNPLFANKRHQPKDNKMSKELIEAFQIENSAFKRSFTVEGWEESKLRTLRSIIGKYIPFNTSVYVYHVSAVHLNFLYNFKLFKEFIGCLQNKKVLLIGGPTVCNSDNVQKAFNISKTIVLSDTNAYELLDSKMKIIETEIASHDVVLSALGHASTVLAKRLFKQGIKTSYIDIGSVVDALAGVKTRGWIKKNWEYIKQRKKDL